MTHQLGLVGPQISIQEALGTRSQTQRASRGRRDQKFPCTHPSPQCFFKGNGLKLCRADIELLVQPLTALGAELTGWAASGRTLLQPIPRVLSLLLISAPKPVQMSQDVLDPSGVDSKAPFQPSSPSLTTFWKGKRDINQEIKKKFLHIFQSHAALSEVLFILTKSGGRGLVARQQMDP